MPEALSRTALILLAAGSSSRMGEPKQLLDYFGKPLLRHCAGTALQSECRPVIVVLGAQAALIRPALHGLDVEVVDNSRWMEGMGTSIRTGLTAAIAHNVDGAILALADQPFVSSAFFDGLIATHRSTARPIVTARYAGTVGVPVYFARQAFPSLFALPPAQGCKGVILSHGDDALRIDCPEAEWDIDTREDYRQATTR